MIILPAIDMRGGRCVRLTQGDYNKETVYSDNPASQAVKWQEDGAEILHLVDLDGAKAGHPVNTDAIKEICSAINIPAELGGGIRTLSDAETVFKLGINRVILGTAACENPSLIKDFINAFGSEKVVLGIDARDGKVAVKGWLETSKTDALELASNAFELGIKRIIYTDISTDGMLSGPNCKAISALASKVPACKIIASGGVSAAPDIKKLMDIGKSNIEGVIVGKALYDGRTNLPELLAISKN